LLKIKEIIRRSERDEVLFSLVLKVIAYTVERAIEVRKIRLISPWKILAHSWDKARMEDLEKLPPSKLKSLLRENPPIVSAYELKRGRIYQIVDGNHRVVLARRYRSRRIPAFITHYFPLPARRLRFRIDRKRVVWKEEGGEYKFCFRLSEEETKYLPEIMVVLRARNSLLLNSHLLTASQKESVGLHEGQSNR